uniref:Dynein heavy chain coiled coil stalk domain-containing protein n=1 Tax=Electrophorus electricus TaxID=8005 RepID=A0A4W4ESA4_ELEEL
MAYVHVSVNKTSKDYLANERRYNYTTPKSFLEQIKLYRNLLALKRKDLTTKMERLENGLQKLNSATAQAKLAAQEVNLKQKTADADKLIQVVGVEAEKVSREKAVADEEEQKVAIPKDRSWKAAKVMMAKVDTFLDSLISFNKEDIHKNSLKAVQPYLQDPEFKPELVAAKSNAAAGLCSWVINIVKFYEVYCEVEPKRQALNKANAELASAQEKLSIIKAKINATKFERATVGGLASENVRWAETVANFRHQERTLCGDVLLITAFVSYLGFFTKRYRHELMDNTWKPYLITPGLDPLAMLMDDADLATWQNEGLPADRMSTENATILTSCERWPLMVDPQLQGIKWIKNKYTDDLWVIRIGQKG